MPIENIGIETRIKTKLSLIITLLLIVSLKHRFLRKINVMENVGVIQPLGSIPLRFPRRTKTKIRPTLGNYI